MQRSGAAFLMNIPRQAAHKVVDLEVGDKRVGRFDDGYLSARLRRKSTRSWIPAL